MGFIDVIKAKARADKKTIVLPESMDRRTWVAAEKILKEDWNAANRGTQCGGIPGGHPAI